MAEYIERKPLLEKCHWIIRSDGTRVYVCHAEDIETAPAADVVPVICGTWKLLRHDKFSDVFKCSECGWKVSLTHGRDVLEQFPYCHCGAKMEDAPCPEHQL